MSKPRDLVIVLAYYENPSMLARQVQALAELPRQDRKALRLVVVDDCSPDDPAVHVLGERLPVWTSLYRMGVDIAWNQDACRNLGVSLGADDPRTWFLLTDMDHIPSQAALYRALYGKLDPSSAYRFARVTAPEMSPYKPHPNSWLLTQATYFGAGGYDERYAGIYGTDGMFASRLARYVAARGGQVADLKEPLIRHPREFVPDASTVRYPRKSPRNDLLRKEIGVRIKAEGPQDPQHFLYPWERLR